MKGPPPPLRFLALVVGGWIGVRAALLAPEWLTHSAEAEARPPYAQIATGTADESRPFRSFDAAATTHSPVRSRAKRQARRTMAFAAAGALPAPEPPIFASSGAVSAAGRADTPAAPEAAAIPGIILQPLPRRPESRWSGSAWLFARGGDGRGLAAGGSLGGSQAGARLLYRLEPRLSLSARLYTPLESTRGAEAALGLEWQPSPEVPLRFLAERRRALGRDGRSAFALLVHGGVSERRVAGPLRLDAYAQAGVVGLSRRDPFADGALRLSLPLKGELSAGAAAWGAAQPGVSRLDVGPSLSLRDRIGGTNLRLSADWRFRIAGEAAPGSGPAVTLASDF